MQNQLVAWVVWFFVIVLAAFTVPFWLLSGVQKFYGAFLFWGVFALAAILSVGIITSKWRD